LLPIVVNHIPVNALVDSGSDVSIISSSFCRKLRCVVTPWSGSTFRGADACVFSKQPIGQCTIRFKIEHSEFCVSAIVFPDAVNDVILGWDFLCDYGALLDCLAEQVIFPFHRVSDFTTNDFPFYSSEKIIARVTNRTVLKSKSATIIEVDFEPHLQENTTVLLSPNKRFSQRTHMLVPYTVAVIKGNTCFVSMLNVLSSD
jgi:hypothetical protein